VNENVLKKDAAGNDFDLKGNNIKNGEPYYDGLYEDRDLVSKEYVDRQDAKQDITINDKLSKDETRQMGGSLDMNNNKIINVGDTTEQDGDAINYRYFNREKGVLTGQINNASAQAVQRDGSVPMTGNLNVDSNKITNLNTDTTDLDSAANVRHVSTSIAKLLLSLTQSFDKKIKESHITSSASKKDAFRYIMEEVDESKSENNIIVDGIKDFPDSPHDVNKKAYLFRMGKGSRNRYSSRLGSNMFKLPDGEYTLAIEFFPPTMDEVSVSVVSASPNIGQQSTKMFPKYSRSIVHLHKYDTTPPEDIYIDMECQGTENSPAQGVGHLIVYGIEGKQNDVDSDVFDALYVLEKGEMVMQTALDINNHHVSGVLVDDNDQKSAVSVGYLEESLRNVRDKVYNDLFKAFADFRTPDTYYLFQDNNHFFLRAKMKGEGVDFSPTTRFFFNEYSGKNGLRHSNDLNLSLFPSSTRDDAEFGFVGILKNGVVFQFDKIRDFSLKFSVVKPFFRLNHGAKIENERLSDSFF